MNLGASEILLILLVVLIVFGGKRLPDLARNIGRGLAEFRRATQDVQREINTTLTDVTAAPKPPAASASHKPDGSATTTAHAHPAAQPRTTKSKSAPDS